MADDASDDTDDFELERPDYSDLWGPTTTIGFNPNEGNLVKYAIREHADAHKAPAEQAKEYTLALTGQKMVSPTAEPETEQHPATREEILQHFNHNRFTHNKTLNEQVQQIVTAMVMRVTMQDGSQRLDDVEKELNSAMEKLMDAHEELVAQMPDEERDQQMSEASDEVLKEYLMVEEGMSEQEAERHMDEEFMG